MGVRGLFISWATMRAICFQARSFSSCAIAWDWLSRTGSIALYASTTSRNSMGTCPVIGLLFPSDEVVFITSAIFLMGRVMLRDMIRDIISDSESSMTSVMVIREDSCDGIALDR